MMVLGQCIGRYWLVLGGTGAVEGGKGKKYLGIRLKRSEIGQLLGF